MFRVFIYVRLTESLRRSLKEEDASSLPLGRREGALKFLGRSGTPDALASFKSAAVGRGRRARGKSFIINLPRGRSFLTSLSHA